MSIVTLETPRLRLRSLEESDLDAYAAMCADLEVMRYIDTGRVLTRAESWRQMALLLGHWRLRGYGMWAAVDRATGVFLGRIGFHYPEGWPGFEIGWMIARPYWGRGLATEGARAALSYGFGELGRRSVISIIQPENRASVRVAEKLGERFERMAQVSGIDVAIYAAHSAER